MHLSQQAIDQILGNAAVGHEFGEKIKELDRRLSMNGMSYSGYDGLTDRQQEIFSQGLFLEPESAMDLREYVISAVDSCFCPDVVEDLHHHSPMLMREIEAEQEKLPDMTIRIGEGINGLDQAIDLLLEQILQEQEQEQADYSTMSKAQLFDKAKELGIPVSRGASKTAMIDVLQNPDSVLQSTLEAENQLEVYLTKGGFAPGAAVESEGRRARHIRAVIPGDLKALTKLFKSKGLTLTSVGGSSYSKGYPNYTLTAAKDIPFQIPGETKSGIKYNKKYLVPKGTSVGFINRTAQSKGEGRDKDFTFTMKELSPGNIGLGGKTFSSPQALAVEAAKLIDKKYPNEPEKAKPLKELLEEALEASGNSIDFKKASLTFDSSDLAIISADFGEVLAAIWSMNNDPLNFDGVEFPGATNEPLIDFYGLTKAEGGEGFDRTPVSCKSGATGGKVSIVNIIDALAKQKAGTNDPEIDENAEYAMELFRMVEQSTAKEGWIGVHRIMHAKDAVGAKISRSLAKITGIKVEDMNEESLEKWALKHYKMPPKGAKKVGPGNGSKYNNRLEELMRGEWYPQLSHGALKKDEVLKQAFLNGYEGKVDPARAILSPLLENTSRILNVDQQMKDSLTSLARQVVLVQTKLDVKTKKMEIRVDYFKDAKFQFRANSYSGKNKVSFTMDFTK